MLNKGKKKNTTTNDAGTAENVATWLWVLNVKVILRKFSFKPDVCFLNYYLFNYFIQYRLLQYLYWADKSRKELRDYLAVFVFN